MNRIEKILNEYNLSIDELETIIKNYDKQSKRFDRILKQSDKQQNQLLNLNEMLEQKEREIRELYEYDYSQQMIAKNKVESTIVNELDGNSKFINKTIFLASDILSGDFYSIYQKDNKIIYYVIDGQGHGISPALTVFSVASIFRDYVKVANSLEELLNYMLNYIKLVLLDAEQLSFTFIEIDFDKDLLTYAIGGMYPTYIKTDEIIKIKANNLPILNFTKEIKLDSIDISNFKSILSYTDGIIENEIVQEFHPKKIIEDISLIDELKEIEDKYKDDDISLVYIEKIK